MKCVYHAEAEFRQVQPRSQKPGQNVGTIEKVGGAEDHVINGTHVRAGECDVIVSQDGQIVEILTAEAFAEKYRKEDGTPFTFKSEGEGVTLHKTRILDLSERLVPTIEEVKSAGYSDEAAKSIVERQQELTDAQAKQE